MPLSKVNDWGFSDVRKMWMIYTMIQTMDDSDREKRLAAAAKKGDTGAFESLVRLHDPALRILSYRLLDQLWTEDVLQEAYLKAYRALDSFRAELGSFGGWLYGIVYRECLTELRRNHRHRLSPSEFLPERIDDQTPPDVAAAVTLDVGSALAALTEEQRAATILVDALGFDYQTAASILGIPRGTVASRLNHARTRLRSALSEEATKLHSSQERKVAPDE